MSPNLLRAAATDPTVDAVSPTQFLAARRTNRNLLAALRPEQREAVAAFIESARPWHELGFDTGPSLTLDDVVCLLSIVANSVRLQCDREPASDAIWKDGSAWPA
jgi:hypothetical protein